MNTRIKGALLIGVALVAAAFVLAQYRSAPTAPTQVAALQPPTIVTQPSLREYIPPVDSNGDGVPDWQELIDRTEPLTVPQRVTNFREPDTLTEQFALDFFQSYVRNSSFGDFGQSPDELIANASDELVAQAQDTLRTTADITAIASTPGTLRGHANRVAAALNAARLPEGTRNELEIVQDAVARSDANQLRELDPILQNYSLVITEMELMAVPDVLVKEHLDLLNTFVGMRNDIAAFRYLFSDPMYALLRLRRYPDDLQGMATAYQNFFEAAREQGAVFEPNDPVYTVYEYRQ
jgi:hypothetical protein